MGATILLEDDATAATGLTFSAAAGATSATQVFHVWYNKGTAGGTARSVRVHAEIEEPGGVWNLSGQPALDEHWIEARINGGVNTAGVAGWVAKTTDWYRLGSGSFLPSPDIDGNTARYLEVRLHPPLKDGAATSTVSFRLAVSYNDNTFGISSGITDAGSGILTGVGDRTVREFVEAPAVTATGSPDADVHVARCWIIYDGIPYRRSAVTDLTLNQNDSALEALTAGQAYKALISQPPGDGTTGVAAVATKGLRAASAASVAPDLPAGHLPVALVTVAYGAGGSVITTGNISSLASGSRYTPSGVGLTAVTFQPGRALLNGTILRDTQPQSFTPAINSTRYYWLTTTGAILESTTTTPPSSGDVPLCKVVKGAATISSITDHRTFFEPNARPVRLSIAGNESSATAVDRARVAYPFAIDRVTAGVRTASAGATGATVLDVNLGGTTIFGTAPSIAAQATADDASYPIVTASEGGWLTLDVDSITSGGSRAVDIEATVWVYPLGRAA